MSPKTFPYDEHVPSRSAISKRGCRHIIRIIRMYFYVIHIIYVDGKVIFNAKQGKSHIFRNQRNMCTHIHTLKTRLLLIS